jgi:hypothetical protein
MFSGKFRNRGNCLCSREKRVIAEKLMFSGKSTYSRQQKLLAGNIKRQKPQNFVYIDVLQILRTAKNMLHVLQAEKFSVLAENLAFNGRGSASGRESGV